MLRCSGAKRLAKSIASSSELTRRIAELRAIDFAADIPSRQFGELPIQFFRDRSREPLRRRQQYRRRIDIMLRLRQHIGREVPRIARGRDNQNLRGTRHEVDADLPRENLLRRRHINIARPDDAVRARHRLRAVRKRRDGMRAAHLEKVRDLQQSRGTENLRDRPRRGHANIRHARHLCRHDRHQQRRRQRIPGPTECTPRPYRAAAQSVPADAPPRTRRSTRAASAASHSGGCYAPQCAPHSGIAGSSAPAALVSFRLRHLHTASGKFVELHRIFRAAHDRRACGPLRESAAPRLRPR